MRPSENFIEGNLMRAHERVLFEKCPLCGQAQISIGKPSRIPFSKPKINPCPSCSAEFAAKGADHFQLVFCEPHRLVGRHLCRDRVFRGCYLGSTLSKLEWEKIALGDESSDYTKFLDMGAKFRRGLLPTYPSEELPFTLEHDETLHYNSSPVYLDEQKRSKEKASDKGNFFLTNKRILYESSSVTVIISLKNVERVEDCPPGFLVKDKDSFEPRYFFPPPYDPVLDAVLGAIHNFKEKR